MMNGEKHSLTALIQEFEDTEKKLQDVLAVYNELRRIVLEKETRNIDLNYSIECTQTRKPDTSKTSLTSQNVSKSPTKKSLTLRDSKINLGKKDSRDSVKSRKSNTSIGFEREVRNRLEHMYALMAKVDLLNVDCAEEKMLLSLLSNF